MRTIYYIMLLIVLAGCNRYEYWDISKFNMDEDALEIGEEIKVLYTSRAPDSNKDKAYFIHYVVVSQQTGDTVNVLSHFQHITEWDQPKKEYIFLQHYALETLSDSMEMVNIDNVEDIKDFLVDPGVETNKVARYPAFDDIADNNYSTIIGSIGFRGEPDKLKTE